MSENAAVNKCSRMVWDYHFAYPCSRLPKVTRNGKPFCTIHDPVRVAAKRKERNEKWERKLAAEDQQRKESKKQQRIQEFKARMFDEITERRTTIAEALDALKTVN